MEENKLVAAVSLLVGVAIGSNWSKIKKYIPMVNDKAAEAKDKMLEVYESAKESVSDAAKVMKEKIAPEAVEVVKHARRRKGRATA